MALGTSQHSSTGKSPFFYTLDATWGNVLPRAVGCLRGTAAFHEMTGMSLRERLTICAEVIRAIRKARPSTGWVSAEPALPAEPAMLAPPVAAAADRVSPAEVRDPPLSNRGTTAKCSVASNTKVSRHLQPSNHISLHIKEVQVQEHSVQPPTWGLPLKPSN